MTRERRPPSRHHAGFTLVELVVVLAILAALATAATLSTEGIVSQSRYDTTRSTLTGVEDAILGRPNLVDSQGRPWVQGFVADVGRLPRITGTPSVDDMTDSKLLSELWLPPEGVAPFAIQMPVSATPDVSVDPEVQLPAGWRGPYIRLPLGASGLRDSWGAPLVLESADGTTLIEGADLGSVGTLGAEKVAGGVDWEADHKIVFASGPPPYARVVGGVPFEVTGEVPATAEADVYVVVRIFAPAEGVLGVFDQDWPADAAPLHPGNPISFTGTFDNVPTGPRALRVYLATQKPDGDPALAPDEVVTGSVRSAVIHLTVVPGGIPPVVVDFD